GRDLPVGSGLPSGNSTCESVDPLRESTDSRGVEWDVGQCHGLAAQQGDEPMNEVTNPFRWWALGDVGKTGAEQIRWLSVAVGGQAHTADDVGSPAEPAVTDRRVE